MSHVTHAVEMLLGRSRGGRLKPEGAVKAAEQGREETGRVGGAKPRTPLVMQGGGEAGHGWTEVSRLPARRPRALAFTGRVRTSHLPGRRKKELGSSWQKF